MEFKDLSSNKDSVKEFLYHKLQNAKDCTGTLQDRLEIRKRVLDELQTQLETSYGLIKVEKLRKNCFHGNYVMNVDILNDTDIDCYNAQCILYWNSSEELRYTTAYYAKDKVDKTKKFPSNSSATLVIIINKPDFKTQTSYTMKGIITYNSCSDTEEQLQSVLPQFTLDINDFTSNIDLKLSNIECGNPLDILGQTRRPIETGFKEQLAHFRLNRKNKSAAADHIFDSGILTFYRHDTLIIYMMNGDTSTTLTNFSFKNRLSVDCALRELSFRPTMKDMYFADDISETINGALLQLCTLQNKPQESAFHETGGIIFHIYTSCNRHLYNFLHYLQTTMGGVQMHFIKDYTHSCSDVNEELKSRKQEKKQLTTMLIKEVYLQNLIENTVQKNDFALRTQRDLIDLEYATDRIIDQVLP